MSDYFYSFEFSCLNFMVDSWTWLDLVTQLNYIAEEENQ